MKPERLEDLGRIRELMERLISDYDELQADCSSKHTREVFVEVYGEDARRYDLHDKLRCLFETLDEIRYIARGSDE